MLKKIVSIKNVGRFRNSAAAGNPQLAKHTFIVGANGFGKTTICAVLRSLHTGDPSHVLGRTTLGVADAAAVDLLLDTCLARFDGAAWTTTHPVAVFDSVFVAENVHSGDAVEIDHKRNLYRVIIGDDGVQLAEEDARLAGESRAKTSDMSAAARAIQPHVPAGMQLDAFIVLPAVADIDAKIAEQERTVEAIRQAAIIKERAVFSEIPLPTLPNGFAALLTRTIDDIAQDAERRLTDHLAAHGMAADGGDWIAAGLAHADGDTCPYCGQDIRGLPLIAAYRAVFSDRYKALAADIAAMQTRITQLFGDAALARLDTLAEQNNGSIEFWGRYCAFDRASLAFPPDVSTAVSGLGTAALPLLDRKARAPLEALPIDGTFTTALAAHGAAEAQTKAVNDAIRSVNALLAARPPLRM